MCHATPTAPGGEPAGRRQDHKFIPRERLRGRLVRPGRRLQANLDWLLAGMPPYFFITLQQDPAALAQLTARLHTLHGGRRLILARRRDRLIVALAERPQALDRTLRTLAGRAPSLAETIRSRAPLPGSTRRLEIQRFEFPEPPSGPDPSGVAPPGRAAGPPARP